MRLKIVSLILVALLSASASAVYTVAENLVSETVWGGPAGEKQVQSFTTLSDTYFITAFEWSACYIDGDPTVQIDLREYYMAEGWYNLDSGALLGSKIETFFGQPWETWLSVTFDVPIPVQPDTQYMMFITNIIDGAGTYRTTYDVYPGGFSARVDNPGTQHWGGPATGDRVFRVLGDVPEPATICLLGLGGLALLRKRR